MRNSFFIIPILFLAASCSKDVKTTYRIVGKDGKVIYIDTRGPEDIDRTRKQFQNPEKRQSNSKPEIKNVNEDKTVKKVEQIEAPLVESSAYTLDSVMDKSVTKYNSNMNNESFKEIGSNKKKRKSISDFDNMHLPYFSDVAVEDTNIGDTKKTTNGRLMNSRKTATGKVTTTAATTAKKSKTIISNDGVSKAGYYLQIGLFSDKKKALNLKGKFSKIYNFDIVEVENKKGEVLYKVITKPLANESEADKISKEIKKAGHNDVFVFKK